MLTCTLSVPVCTSSRGLIIPLTFVAPCTATAASCRFTEADLRLFPTVCRFDAVYSGIFKCGRRRVSEYPNLQAWMRDVWQIATPGGMQVGWFCIHRPRAGVCFLVGDFL
jgi:hypothetical protein